METIHVIRVPTTGVFDFERLVTSEKAKYIDKTDLLYKLCNDADQQLFISRPRRFGKSLMLSTLKAMFEGRRGLFRGLAIDKLPWGGWNRPTPVYSFTMSSATGTTFELFEAALSKLVENLCKEVDSQYDSKVDAAVNFEEFLKAAAAKSPTKKIVILIDEYDETSEAAIRQIRERGYADKWISGNRPVTLIGINFNPKKRNIDIPSVEPA